MLQSVSDIAVRLRPGGWPMADAWRPQIDANWQRRLAANPHIWNGRVLGTIAPGQDGGLAMADGVLTGQAVEADYATFLAWRDWGFPDIGICNLFGSALVMSSDGALILGVMAATTVNAGQIYPPGGSLEPADVDALGNVGVVASIERELHEETGLVAADAMVEGTYVAFDGPRVSVGRVFRFNAVARDLVDEIMANLDGQAERELETVMVFRGASDLDRPAVTAYTRLFGAALLGD